MEEKLNDILKQGLEKWGIQITNKQLQQFNQYKTTLLEHNKNINLTAIKEEEEIYKKHFLDSISPLNIIDIPQNAKIIDVGTGAGFPSIPIKIMRPDINLTLLDSLNKRINFLKIIGQQLNLENITYIHTRAEDGARQKNLRENYDYCLTRAVANLSTLLEYSTPYIKVGGTLICLKGPSAKEEIKKATKALKTLGCEIEQTKDITIPNTDLNHKIIIIKKIKPTPNTYPRKAGNPSKNPL